MNPLALLRTPRLAAHASHEVRGPLTVALLSLEGMVARGEVHGEAARGLELQLRRARLAVDDLAAVAQGGRAPDRLEPVTVSGLLAQVGLAWRPAARAHGVDLWVVNEATAGDVPFARGRAPCSPTAPGSRRRSGT